MKKLYQLETFKSLNHLPVSIAPKPSLTKLTSHVIKTSTKTKSKNLELQNVHADNNTMLITKNNTANRRNISKGKIKSSLIVIINKESTN